MKPVLGYLRRALLNVARTLRLLGPIDRLHRIEERLADLQQTACRSEARLIGLQETFATFRESFERVACSHEARLAGLQETSERIERGLQDMRILVASRAAGADVDRLDGYLLFHVAKLREEAAAATSEISDKVEAEIDRLDKNLVHHIAVLRRLAVTAIDATTSSGKDVEV